MSEVYGYTVSEDKQRAIMGDKRFKAWQDGAFEFGDMAISTHSHTWGGGIRITALRDLLPPDYEFEDFARGLSESANEIPTLAGVARGELMTRDEANGGNPNPLFSEGGGYMINCQTCVVTYEARLRGYDVTALPNAKGSMLETLSRNTRLAWIDKRTGEAPEFNSTAGVKYPISVLLNLSISTISFLEFKHIATV